MRRIASLASPSKHARVHGKVVSPAWRAPHLQRSVSDPGRLEELRRLAYVNAQTTGAPHVIGGSDYLHSRPYIMPRYLAHRRVQFTEDGEDDEDDDELVASSAAAASSPRRSSKADSPTRSSKADSPTLESPSWKPVGKASAKGRAFSRDNASASMSSLSAARDSRAADSDKASVNDKMSKAQIARLYDDKWREHLSAERAALSLSKKELADEANRAELDDESGQPQLMIRETDSRYGHTERASSCDPHDDPAILTPPLFLSLPRISP